MAVEISIAIPKLSATLAGSSIGNPAKGTTAFLATNHFSQPKKPFYITTTFLEKMDRSPKIHQGVDSFPSLMILQCVKKQLSNRRLLEKHATPMENSCIGFNPLAKSGARSPQLSAKSGRGLAEVHWLADA